MEPSLAVIASEQDTEPKEGAGFGVRFGARVIDMVIHYIIWFAIPFVVGTIVAVYAAIAEIPLDQILDNSMPPLLIRFLLPTTSYVLFYAFSECIAGTTVGKLIFRLHVVSIKSKPITFSAALKRSLSFYVDSLLLGLVAYDSMRKSLLNQRIGDRWADTVVVPRANLISSQIPSTGKYILAILVSVVVNSSFALLSSILEIF